MGHAESFMVLPTVARTSVSVCALTSIRALLACPQHHCRACGQIFCGKCSSKYSTIPKFGIEKEVRVCEPCFELLNK